MRVGLMVPCYIDMFYPQVVTTMTIILWPRTQGAK